MINFCKLLDAHTGMLERHLEPARISDVRAEREKIIWLDIEKPDEEDLRLLSSEFGFHPLAIEDCRNAHQRPKLEKYEGYLFLVLYELSPVATGARLAPVEVALFLGHNYVVTVHHYPAPIIKQVETRWEASEGFGKEGASYLAYLLIDMAVDTYFPIIDAFSDRLEELEEAIFGHFDPLVVESIFHLKKETLLLRRLVTPLRDVFLVLLRTQEGYFGPRTYLYFQDVLDHLLRISDSIDTYRDLVTSAVDAYMSMVSNRTNETMKVLTVFSTVLMTAALVPAIYGMNFKVIPELNWPQGYSYSLALMAAISLALVGLFKWKRYF